jgi:hypothetical protein
MEQDGLNSSRNLFMERNKKKSGNYDELQNRISVIVRNKLCLGEDYKNKSRLEDLK